LAAVAGERVKLPVTERKKLGSAESRRLRRQGLVPGVIYGRSEPVAISIGERELRAALSTAGGSHAVLEVAIDGGREHSAILKEYQRDKVRGTITHVDLQEIRLDQRIHSAVAVTLVGEPAGVKEGGVLTQVVNEVHVEGLPLEIPQHLDVDVSEMHIGDSLRLDELTVPDGITLLDDIETVLATVTVPTRVEEPEVEEEEGEEGVEGEVPEGAEGAEEAAAEEGAAPESGEE
jgi:large subunit ribosomal protein L25